MVDVNSWDRMAAMAEVVVESCAVVGIRPNADVCEGYPRRLLAQAVEVALTARRVESADASAVAAHCFDRLTRPYRRYATIGAVAFEEFLPPLVADAVLAAGWLAESTALLAQGDGKCASEAGQNCLDACVRLHVFTGQLGSRVQRAFDEHCRARRKGPVAEQ